MRYTISRQPGQTCRIPEFAGFAVIQICRLRRHPNLPASPSFKFAGFAVIQICRLRRHPNLPALPSSKFAGFAVIQICRLRRQIHNVLFEFAASRAEEPLCRGFPGAAIRTAQKPHRYRFPLRHTACKHPVGCGFRGFSLPRAAVPRVPPRRLYRLSGGVRCGRRPDRRSCLPHAPSAQKPSQEAPAAQYPASAACSVRCNFFAFFAAFTAALPVASAAPHFRAVRKTGRSSFGGRPENRRSFRSRACPKTFVPCSCPIRTLPQSRQVGTRGALRFPRLPKGSGHRLSRGPGQSLRAAARLA